MIGVVLATTLTFPALPAQANESLQAIATETEADPDKILIHDASAPSAYRFSVPVPEGGQLRPLPGGEILVQNAAGVAIGAYDQAWAQDADGQYVATSYRVESTAIVQVVEIGPSTSFPVVIDPIYSPIGHQVDGWNDPTILAFVSVPSNYIYNPALGALHDYCTSSPDQFPNPIGANADFRGPCARHDMCYEGGTTSQFTCDNRLLDDMVANCVHAYAWYNPARAACNETAVIYWAAVIVA